MNPATNTGTTGTTGTAGNQDALDKGVDAGLKHFNKGQSASTTEKISDGIRTGFKKVTGKDVPIQDKQVKAVTSEEIVYCEAEKLLCGSEDEKHSQ